MEVKAVGVSVREDSQTLWGVEFILVGEDYVADLDDKDAKAMIDAGRVEAYKAKKKK